MTTNYTQKLVPPLKVPPSQPKAPQPPRPAAGGPARPGPVAPQLPPRAERPEEPDKGFFDRAMRSDAAVEVALKTGTSLTGKITRYGFFTFQLDDYCIYKSAVSWMRIVAWGQSRRVTLGGDPKVK